MSVILDKLLKGQKVEWRLFGEVAKIQRGASPRPIAQYITDDINGIPWIKIGDTKVDSKYITTTAQRVTPEGAKKSRILKKGDFIMSNSMSFGRPYILSIDGAIHDGWASISDFSEFLNSDFLYHYLSSNWVKNYWLTKINSGSVSNLNADIIKTLPTPIPPLDVQAKIVKILDAFTALTTELTAELTMREKQYHYYRDNLLTFSDDEVKWKTLGDVVLPTKNIKWKETNLSYKYIDLSSVDRGNNNIGETLEITSKNAPSRAQKIVKQDDIIFATTRPTQMRVAIIPKNFDEQIASTGYCILRANQKEILPKWIYYNLSLDRFKFYLEENQSGVAYPAISDGMVKEFQIPIPSLKEQKRIIEILDKFEILNHSITEGLPKEIALRQKQYEYYREQLLDFPK